MVLKIIQPSRMLFICSSYWVWCLLILVRKLQVLETGAGIGVRCFNQIDQIIFIISYKSTGGSGMVVRPTSKKEVFGFRFLSLYQWKFSKYLQPRLSGGSEPTLNCKSHHKEISDLQGRGSISQAKLLGDFWVILRDLFVLILEDSQNP